MSATLPSIFSHDLDGPVALTMSDGSTAGVTTNGELISHVLGMLTTNCHAASFNRGWWHDPITGKSLIPSVVGVNDMFATPMETKFIAAWFPFVVGTKLNLIHDEVSEASEAYRVDAVDDKIPMPGITAELADTVIRIADLLGCLQMATEAGYIDVPPSYLDLPVGSYRELYDLGRAYMLKTPVNATRKDHDLTERAKPGAKKW